MDKKYFIANWKSHKNEEEVGNFFDIIGQRKESFEVDNKVIIIAPPYPLLPAVKKHVENSNLPFFVSSQDVSGFEEGAYTGEVSAKLVSSYAKYSIIGHSERRDNFRESDELLIKKVDLAISSGLAPIFCVQDENQGVPERVGLVAFEPPTAIGTGNPDDPEHIEKVFNTILSKNTNLKVLYGGSVTPDNIESFLRIENLSGFLVGGASLDAESFAALLSKW